MKQILILALAVVLVASVCEAQINLSYTSALNRVTYVNSENDTGTVAGQYVAGANLLSLVISSEDSVNVDFVIQYKANGSWTDIVTDSLVSAVNTGRTREISLRDSDSDLMDGIYYPLRIIVAARASGNGVTTPYLTARWYYRL